MRVFARRKWRYTWILFVLSSIYEPTPFSHRVMKTQNNSGFSLWQCCLLGLASHKLRRKCAHLLGVNPLVFGDCIEYSMKTPLQPAGRPLTLTRMACICLFFYSAHDGCSRDVWHVWWVVSLSVSSYVDRRRGGWWGGRAYAPSFETHVASVMNNGIFAKNQYNMLERDKIEIAVLDDRRNPPAHSHVHQPLLTIGVCFLSQILAYVVCYWHFTCFQSVRRPPLYLFMFPRVIATAAYGHISRVPSQASWKLHTKKQQKKTLKKKKMT